MVSPLKELFDEQGYVVVSGLVSPDHRAALEDACAHAIARTRAGDWPHRRTVGRQFPPYGDDDPDSWGVQHLMHPALGEPAFARWYTSDALLAAVEELLSCSEDDLQMGASLSLSLAVAAPRETGRILQLCSCFRAFQSAD